MARRNTDTSTTEVTETPDTTVEGTEPEGTEPTTQGTEPEVKAEVEVDLSAFQAAVTTALVEQDETTGELPLAAIEPVNVEFRKLDGTKAKNKAKTFLEDSMKEALMGLGAYADSGANLQDARSFVQIKDNLTAAKSGGGSTERTPVDPKVAYVNRLTALNLAAQIAADDMPEGLDADEVGSEVTSLMESVNEQVEAYRTYLNAEVPEGEEKPEAPEVSAVVKQAFKLSAGRSVGRPAGGSNGGPRHDVAKHIASAFAEVESGTFLSVADIAKHTSEEYGDEHPSQGAVQARLFPKKGKSTIEGVTPVDRTSENPRGARKN